MLYKRSLSLINTFLMAAVVAAFICSNAAAETADWKPYAADKYFFYYYDANGVVYPHKSINNVLNLELADAGIVRVRTKSVMKDERGRELKIKELKKCGFATKGYDNYSYSASLVEVNCVAKKYRLFSESDYSKEGSQIGSPLKEPGAAGWEPIVAGSEVKALQDAVCHH